MGMGKAVELAAANLEKDSRRIVALRDRLMKGILERVPDSRVNGDTINRLPNNLNMCFRYIEGEALLLRLDLAGIEGSSGSACTSGSLDPSHVLLAIGLPHEIARARCGSPWATQRRRRTWITCWTRCPKLCARCAKCRRFLKNKQQFAEDKDMLYSERVMDHFEHPRNVGEIENADGIGQVGNAKCGDIMRMYIRSTKTRL